MANKKQFKSDYKWAKVYGYELEDVKKRLSELEETVRLIREDLDKLRRDLDETKK